VPWVVLVQRGVEEDFSLNPVLFTHMGWHLDVSLSLIIDAETERAFPSPFSRFA